MIFLLLNFSVHVSHIYARKISRDYREVVLKTSLRRLQYHFRVFLV